MVRVRWLYSRAPLALMLRASGSGLPCFAVNQLEAELGEFTGSNHCICCGNGTDALILALMAWNIGPGDAVFVPDFTCFASVTCIMTRGAEPIFVDIDIDTFNMDPDSLGEAISDVINEGRLRPRVIMPVDLFGLPANYSKIRELAKEHSLYVLEDAAPEFRSFNRRPQNMHVWRYFDNIILP